MDNNKCEKLVLNMVNFYTLFEKEFSGLIPEINEKGITPMFSRILNEIYLKGRTTSKDIGEALNLSVPNTSRAVNTLYKMGKIEKKQCASDKRITYITLSHEGLELVNKFILKYQEKYFEKLSVLTAGELDELNENFDRIKSLFIKLNTKG